MSRAQLTSALLVGLFPVFGSIACSKIEVQEIPLTANPTQEIESLERAQDEARVQQSDVLAPQYFKDSKEELAEAKASRAKDQDSKVILKHVARGQANLVKAQEMTRLAHTALEPVVTARAAAMAANAPQLVDKDFLEADQSLIVVTKDIENNQMGAAEKQRDTLAKVYSDLELRAIKETNLGEARKTIEQAKKEGGKETASRTFQEANTRLTEAENFISANRQDKGAVAAQGAAALASAKHLLEVTRQSKVVDKKDAESIVLEREAQAGRINAMASAGAQTQDQLAQLQDKSQALASENQQLEAQKRLDAMLDSAKALFTADEAEVYRDGKKLVIRMKKLAFPNGKANLTPESMPLLAKVNQSIRDLGVNSRIEVQGHTDATGDHKANQMLSEKRAEAIKAYLGANGLDPQNITTIGYGDTKPIASNKTKTGKAQNRRVDIVIEPRSPVS